MLAVFKTKKGFLLGYFSLLRFLWTTVSNATNATATVAAAIM
jgi:hypothetical protein